MKKWKKLIKGCKKKFLGAGLITFTVMGFGPFFLFLREPKYYGFRGKNKNKPVVDG